MEKYDFERFGRESLSMWYKGQINDDITENLIDLSESDIGGGGLGKSKKKVSFLMAESFQNIVRHGLKDQIENNIPGSFGFTNREGQIHIFSSNLISHEHAKDLESKLKYETGYSTLFFITQDVIRITIGAR